MCLPTPRIVAKGNSQKEHSQNLKVSGKENRQKKQKKTFDVKIARKSRTAAKPIAQQAASPYLNSQMTCHNAAKKRSANEVPQCESKHVLRSKSRDITQTSKRWGGFTTPDFQISVTQFAPNLLKLPEAHLLQLKEAQQTSQITSR